MHEKGMYRFLHAGGAGPHTAPFEVIPTSLDVPRAVTNGFVSAVSNALRCPIAQNTSPINARNQIPNNHMNVTANSPSEANALVAVTLQLHPSSRPPSHSIRPTMIHPSDTVNVGYVSHTGLQIDLTEHNHTDTDTDIDMEHDQVLLEEFGQSRLQLRLPVA